MGKRRTQKNRKTNEDKQIETQEFETQQQGEYSEDRDNDEETQQQQGELELGNEPNEQQQGELELGNEPNEQQQGDKANVLNGEGEAYDAADDTEENTPTESEPKRKRPRGPTMMKHISKDPNARHHVDFTDMGEPCGPGSVSLSSYLGPLVREHVPMIIENWKKVGEDIKTVLWKSIQARFDLDEGYKKNAVFKQMGCLWRASKSRLVGQVKAAMNMKERMNLRPQNVPATEWRKFVKEKTSTAFKVVSDSYKKRRQKQIPHTCGRKGMVRLREDMVKSSSEPSEVTRLKVWVKSRTKKDGTPVNINAAEKIKKASEIDVVRTQDSSTTNPKEDMLTQILGPDNPGRLRAMGRGMSLTKLACFQVKSNCMAAMEENQIMMQNKIQELQQTIEKMNNQRQDGDVGENSIHTTVNKRALPKCFLVDWSSCDENVAEGRVVSYEAEELVKGIPLGPNAVKVLVEIATKPDAFLWRPAPEMFTIADVVGEMVAWHADYCIVPTTVEDIAPTSPNTTSKNKCKLMDYVKNDEVVAEGRWQTRDPKELVNGIPLGPNALKVFVDNVLNDNAYLWRPTVEIRTLKASLNCYVAWPASRVVMETTTPISRNENSPVTTEDPEIQPSLKAPSPSSRNEASHRGNPQHLPCKENKKCKLMDLSGKKRVVAEGRWSSNNPEQVIHFVPLGPNACRVWVDVVKVTDAAVWKPCSEIQCMEDALGTSIAWPEDKIMME